MNTVNIIELHLHSKSSHSQEIESLEFFIKENRLKNILTKKQISKEPSEWVTQGDEYLPILQLILSPIVTVAGIKGVFDVLKNYFDIRKQEISNKIEGMKIENEQKKISLTYSKEDGSKLELEFYSFDESERLQFQEWINRIFSQK